MHLNTVFTTCLHVSMLTVYKNQHTPPFRYYPVETKLQTKDNSSLINYICHIQNKKKKKERKKPISVNVPGMGGVYICLCVRGWGVKAVQTL